MVCATHSVSLSLAAAPQSHVDYLTVHYVCFVHHLPIPYVVAGDNLNIPVIGHILRMCGAFFIRRSFGGDVLYKAVFQACTPSPRPPLRSPRVLVARSYASVVGKALVPAATEPTDLGLDRSLQRPQRGMRACDGSARSRTPCVLVSLAANTITT